MKNRNIEIHKGTSILEINEESYLNLQDVVSAIEKCKQLNGNNIDVIYDVDYHQCNFEFYHVRQETDEELEVRNKREKIAKTLVEKVEYQNYLKLKEKYKDIEEQSNNK